MSDVQRKKGTKMLYVELSDFEKKEQNLRMIKALKEKSRLEDAKKASADQFKKDIEYQDGNIKDALGLVDKGRMQDVDVDEIFDFELRTVTIMRLDTGEIVEQRDMTKDEMQLELL